MARSRARRLSPVLALLVVAAGASLGSPRASGRIGAAATSPVAALRATSAAVEAVLPLKPEQTADRVGHPGGGKQRLPLGLAVVATGLPALAVAFGAGRRPRLLALRPPWFTVSPSRGPPLLRLAS